MRLYNYLGILLIVSSALFGTECWKDLDPITETVIKTDTVYVATHDTIVHQITDTVTLNTFLQDSVTTFLLVRHAETVTTGTDPALSVAGQGRAADLARVLKSVSLQAAYASNYARTKQTAQVTATDQSLSVQIYDPLAPAALADNLLATYQGKNVLVVGHSNTIPTLLNVLTGTNDYSIIPETEYDNLYVVSVYAKGAAKVVHLKYGE